MKGYVFVMEGLEIYPVLVEDPKREVIEPGDLLLIEEYDGVILQVKACSGIQSHYNDELDKEEIAALMKMCGMKKMSKVIGTVINDFWYGREDEYDEK